MRRTANLPLLATSGIVLACAALGASVASAGTMSGAIFTTLEDGTFVNHNSYDRKQDVYLDGGAGPNAPATSAGLEEGYYYFQVTDPSGSDLLSSDHISCRMVHVGADGRFDDYVEGGTNYEWSRGAWSPVACSYHDEGFDVDHEATTVQLYPYDTTPNRGGVYKVWVTPVDFYACDPDWVPTARTDAVNGENCGDGRHGFVPAYTKTDNYKVKGNGFVTPVITVSKFHDADMDGLQGDGEETITGWAMSIEDPLGLETLEYTGTDLSPLEILAAVAGTYWITEETPDGTVQTTAWVDTTEQSWYPTADPTVSVLVAGTSRETHTVVFGNVGAGEIEFCKVFDRDGDGTWDDGEPTIAGWPFTLTGTDVSGLTYGPTTITTDSEGCGTFGEYPPGTYYVTEATPLDDGIWDWSATGETTITVTITSTLVDGMPEATVTMSSDAFYNVAWGYADFGTKGYWHNKNGMDEISEADIAYVNGLDPYDSETDYFDDGDEPFDGYFSDGSCVDAAYSHDYGSLVWGACTPRAEISQFLVDRDPDDAPDQLAQQLLAFIFNVRNRLDCEDPADARFVYGSTYYNAGDLISEAISVWADPYGDWSAMSSVLTDFNESDALPYVPCEPPDVTFP